MLSVMNMGTDRKFFNTVYALKPQARCQCISVYPIMRVCVLKRPSNVLVHSSRCL